MSLMTNLYMTYGYEYLQYNSVYLSTVNDFTPLDT